MPSDQLLTYTELGISSKFSVINQKLRHMFDDTFSEIDITGTQAAILHFIYTKGKYQNIYKREIEMEFSIRRSSVTSMINSLESNGFIQRDSVQEDS